MKVEEVYSDQPERVKAFVVSWLDIGCSEHATRDIGRGDHGNGISSGSHCRFVGILRFQCYADWALSDRAKILTDLTRIALDSTLQ